MLGCPGAQFKELLSKFTPFTVFQSKRFSVWPPSQMFFPGWDILFTKNWSWVEDPLSFENNSPFMSSQFVFAFSQLCFRYTNFSHDNKISFWLSPSNPPWAASTIMSRVQLTFHSLSLSILWGPVHGAHSRSVLFDISWHTSELEPLLVSKFCAPFWHLGIESLLIPKYLQFSSTSRISSPFWVENRSSLISSHVFAPQKLNDLQVLFLLQANPHLVTEESSIVAKKPSTSLFPVLISSNAVDWTFWVPKSVIRVNKMINLDRYDINMSCDVQLHKFEKNRFSIPSSNSETKQQKIIETPKWLNFQKKCRCFSFYQVSFSFKNSSWKKWSSLNLRFFACTWNAKFLWLIAQVFGSSKRRVSVVLDCRTRDEP